jgi:hypothetical protein
MLFDKESGVGARGTVRVPARGMTDRSVRKRQQPPSLKRQELMLRRWEGSVNSLSIGVARNIHDGSSRNRAVATCERRAES